MSNDIMDIGFAPKGEPKQENALAMSSEARAVAEVQAQYVIAKKFPRNQHQAYMDIIDSCKRPLLASQAIYAYPRGNTLVTGPSIRLAESLSQSWGNIDCGIRELSQDNGVSVCEAYAIDLQTNIRVVKAFHVPHTRDTKQGKKKLTDSRDILEAVASQGARRLRGCLLAIIPGDVVDAAVQQCAKTLESSDIPMSERINKMVVAFSEFGINVEHLEARLGHNLDATIPAELVTLQSIYRSIKDGMADRSQFFDIKSKVAEDSKNELMGLLGIDEPQKEGKKKNDRVADS